MFLTPDDLAPFATIDPAKAQAMIDDATSLALLAAPALADLPADDPKRAAVKAVIRGAVLRWNDSGSGAFTQQSITTGPMTVNESIDSRTRRTGMFYPSELDLLRELAGGTTDDRRAFTIDTLSRPSVNHLPWCAAMMGATYCSCGADIAGYPIYEGGLEAMP